MGTKETLRRRKDIPDDQVEELVSRAARLQDQALASPEGASESEIAAVAEELDIDPQYVEAAIAQWRTEQESDESITSREKVQLRGRRFLKGILAFGGVVLVGVPLLGWAVWTSLGATALWTMGAIAAAVVAGLIWLVS